MYGGGGGYKDIKGHEEGATNYTRLTVLCSLGKVLEANIKKGSELLCEVLNKGDPKNGGFKQNSQTSLVTTPHNKVLRETEGPSISSPLAARRARQTNSLWI